MANCLFHESVVSLVVHFFIQLSLSTTVSYLSMFTVQLCVQCFLTEVPRGSATHENKCWTLLLEATHATSFLFSSRPCQRRRWTLPRLPACHRSANLSDRCRNSATDCSPCEETYFRSVPHLWSARKLIVSYHAKNSKCRTRFSLEIQLLRISQQLLPTLTLVDVPFELVTCYLKVQRSIEICRSECLSAF